MAQLKEPDAEVISVVYSKFARKMGDDNLTIWKHPKHLTLEIAGRRGGRKAQLLVTFAAAKEMAQEILDVTA